MYDQTAESASAGTAAYSHYGVFDSFVCGNAEFIFGMNFFDKRQSVHGVKFSGFQRLGGFLNYKNTVIIALKKSAAAETVHLRFHDYCGFHECIFFCQMFFVRGQFDIFISGIEVQSIFFAEQNGSTRNTVERFIIFDSAENFGHGAFPHAVAEDVCF